MKKIIIDKKEQILIKRLYLNDKLSCKEISIKLNKKYHYLKIYKFLRNNNINTKVHIKQIKYLIDKNGCHNCISHSINSSGYPIIKGILAHRYIWKQKYGKISKGMCVCHKCDNRECINIEHLFIGTHKDNMQDCVKKGRNNKQGINNGRNKITEKQVIKIFNSTLSNNQLSKKYKITSTNIWSIKKGKTWKHITNKLVNKNENNS